MDDELRNFLSQYTGVQAKSPLEVGANKEDLLKAIVVARIAKRLTQRQLANLCGCSQPAIARLESGHSNPSLHTLLRLCSALGLRLTVQ